MFRVFGATSTMDLTKGKKVEVHSDEKGSEGTWFEAFVKAIVKIGRPFRI